MKIDEITDEIMTRLRTIKKTAGYSADIAEVTDFFLKQAIASPLPGPTISVVPGTLTPEFVGEKASMTYVLELECIVPSMVGENPRRPLHNLLGDVFRAIGIAASNQVQRTLGGLAASIEVGEISFPPPEPGSGYLAAIIPLTVRCFEL